MSEIEAQCALNAQVLATRPFFTCFYVWVPVRPLSPIIQHHLKLSGVELGWLLAVPVMLGSDMRLPMGSN